jgi:hypothetical protein
VSIFNREGAGVNAAAAQFGTSTGVGAGSSPLTSSDKETNAKTVNLDLYFISFTTTALLSKIVQAFVDK